MATSVKPKVEPVEIHGEYYVLDKIPAKNSLIVKERMENLLVSVDLKNFVTDLGRIGSFIRIAYNGVGAVGYRFTEQQIEIQRLGYDITKLSDKSALAISKFKKASSYVLTDLQCTYGYLLDNLEEMAVDTLSSVSTVAEEMEKTALELHDEFEREGDKVKEALEKTQRAKQNKAKEDERKEKERIKLEERIRHEKEIIKDHERKEEEAEARHQELQEMEEKAIKEIGMVTGKAALKSIANALTSKFGFGKPFDPNDTDAEKRADKFRQSRLDALEAEKDIREKRQKALANMSSFAAKLKQCSTGTDGKEGIDEKEIAKVAENALHEAGGALKDVSAMMMKAATFWQEMKDHCNMICGSKMRSQVETALKLSEEKRLKIWNSPFFMRKAIMFYSEWVALSNVCELYMVQIKETQRNLYKYITENPTQEGSKKMLSLLADDFLADIRQEQMAIKEKDLKAQEEIQALGPAGHAEGK